MNLYFRLIALIIRLLFTRPHEDILTPSRLRFTVLPLDMDINIHLTNARYLGFMDLARIHLLAKMGLLNAILKRKWMPVIHSCLITYIRPIPPLTRIEIITELVYWDDKYFYIEQKFTKGDTLFAVALVRGLFLHGKRKVPAQDIVNLSHQAVTSPPAPDAVLSWIDALEHKKAAAEKKPRK